MTVENVAEILTALAAVAAVVVSLINGKKINDVHISINSRMDQLLRATGIAAKAEGVEQERRQSNKNR
jgi:hypothetical protein